MQHVLQGAVYFSIEASISKRQTGEVYAYPIVTLSSMGSLMQELSMENYAPKELQPLKDFLAAKGTRIFLRIDYPRLCCQ